MMRRSLYPMDDAAREADLENDAAWLREKEREDELERIMLENRRKALEKDDD